MRVEGVRADGKTDPKSGQFPPALVVWAWTHEGTDQFGSGAKMHRYSLKGSLRWRPSSGRGRTKLRISSTVVHEKSCTTRFEGSMSLASGSYVWAWTTDELKGRPAEGVKIDPFSRRHGEQGNARTASKATQFSTRRVDRWAWTFTEMRKS